MRIYLEPKGWPTAIGTAPNGLVARTRKGKTILYFKNDGESMNVPPFVMEMNGNLTTVTGMVTPVVMRIEESK